MYIHKYVADGDVFYRLSGSSSKPSGSIVLSVNDWKARLNANTGKISQVLTALERAFAMRGREPELEEEEKELEEKKAFFVPLTEHLRYLARVYARK